MINMKKMDWLLFEPKDNSLCGRVFRGGGRQFFTDLSTLIVEKSVKHLKTPCY
jgi:hypothetical protein